MHTEAVTAAGAALIRFARSCGLIRGEWIAIDGSKFRAVASIDTVRERIALQRYLETVEKADAGQEPKIDQSALVPRKSGYRQLGALLRWHNVSSRWWELRRSKWSMMKPR